MGLLMSRKWYGLRLLSMIIDYFISLLNSIRQGDHYLITDDFDSYIAALAMVDEAYLDRDEWIKKSIRTTAKVTSRFTSFIPF